MDPLTRPAALHLADVLHAALTFNLLDYHRTHGESLWHATLYRDLVGALKWLHHTDPAAALDVVGRTLEDVRTTPDGPPRDYVVRCLSLSLHIADDTWPEARADRFIADAVAAI